MLVESSATHIKTAGVSIVIDAFTTAPDAPLPTPLITTEGASVYPFPPKARLALYNSPLDTFADPTAVVPPGNCGLSIITVAEV